MILHDFAFYVMYTRATQWWNYCLGFSWFTMTNFWEVVKMLIFLAYFAHNALCYSQDYWLPLFSHESNFTITNVHLLVCLSICPQNPSPTNMNADRSLIFFMYSLQPAAARSASFRGQLKFLLQLWLFFM